MMLRSLVAAFALIAAGAPAAEGRRTDPAIGGVAAAPYGALPAGKAAPGFSAPQVGPWVECAGIRRRAIVMNPSLVAGQPLRIRLEVECVAPPGQEVEFQGRLLWGLDIQAVVDPPHAQPFAYVPVKAGSLVGNTVIQLTGRRRGRVDMEMVADPESVTGALFDTPGKYAIRLTHTCVVTDKPPQGQLDLGSFEVTVAEATGEDRAALDALSRDPADWLPLQTLVGFSPAQLKLYEDLAGKLTAARIRPNLLFAIASSHLARGGDPLKARPYLEEIARAHPGHPLAEDARLRLLAVYRIAGETARESALFRELWQDPVAVQRILMNPKVLATYVAPPDRTRTQWMLFETPGPDLRPPQNMVQVGGNMIPIEFRSEGE
jgi:hypothetical protein